MRASRSRPPGAPATPRRSLARRTGYLADPSVGDDPYRQVHVRPPTVRGQVAAVVLLAVAMWLLTHPAVLAALVLGVVGLAGLAALAALWAAVGRRVVSTHA